MKKYNIQIDNTRNNLITEFSDATTKDRYRIASVINNEDGSTTEIKETQQELYARCSSAYADNEEHAQRLYDYISKMWFMPATPILANGGTNSGMPISCFVNEVQDTVGGVIDINTENGWLAISGGGIGTFQSNIREQGCKISSRGVSLGVVPEAKMMEATTRTSILSDTYDFEPRYYDGIIPGMLKSDVATLARTQAGIRRGSSAVYLNVSHPEIEEFIDIRRPTGGDFNRKCLNLNHAVCISDEFMKAVERGEMWELKSPKDGRVVEEVNARNLWIKILTARIETGEPYLLFTGNVNKNKSKVYTELEAKYNQKVKTSNLCVAPETLILTSNGWQEIQNCANEKTTIWNGFEWSEVTPRKTGENQNLITVKTSDGQTLECTEYHKWYIQKQDSRGMATKIIKKSTNELCIGDKIIKSTFPVIHGGLDLDFSYANGFYSGDGCQLKSGKSRIYLYGDKHKCQSRLELDKMPKINEYRQEAHNRIYFDIQNGVLKYKFYVPTSDYTIKSKLNWLAGLCDSDGTVARNGRNQSLQIASVNYDFLLQTQKMLQELGCNPKITLARSEGMYKLPKNDGSNKLAFYKCKAANRLLINSNDLHTLVCMGLRFERLKYLNHLPQRKAAAFVYIKEIKNENRISDTYCFTEPKRGTGVFNGILTGNCNEIHLLTGFDHLQKERTAVCCLSSLNLEYYEEWKNNELFIEDVARFLDNVLQDFIDRAPNSMQKAKYSAMRERSIGIGVMGFHSFLQSKKTPFASVSAKSWNKAIFKHIKEKCDIANEKLTDEKGACPDALELGIKRRFSNMQAIAPTASISNICGESSPGIEPYAANVYTQKTLSGSFIVRNKSLKKLLKEKGYDTDAVWSSISLNEGSVQHLDFLNQDEKDVFKTAMEIDQRWIIEHAADRQPFIDQGQSVNMFFASNVEKRVLHDIHFAAWKKGVKGLYYCRSASIQRAEKSEDKFSKEQEAAKDVIAQTQPEYDECLACQ